MIVVDIVAGTLMVGGTLLMAFGSFGLLRFPDVLTRMHAATKAATVGVVATTAAAAVTVDAVGGVLVLGLVILLLFLSAPLGMSLLARAAYHDPQTPKAATSQVRITSEPSPPLAASSPPKTGYSLLLFGWLLIVWIALFGSVTMGVVVGGAVVAGLMSFSLRRLAPSWPVVVLHPLRTGAFVGFFLQQVVLATWDVIATLWVPAADLRPVVVEIPLRVRSRGEITLLMGTVSMTPGTVALEVGDGTVFVHVLNAESPDQVARQIVEMESYIMAMYGHEPVADAL